MELLGTGVAEAFEFVGEDALLLHEFAHRTSNEVASATAAMRLASRATPAARASLIESAIWRLEGFGELNRMLARPVRGRVNVAADLASACAAIAAGAATASRSEMRLDLPDTWVGANVARRLVLIAVELVNNAVRHALDGRAGLLTMMLRIQGEDLLLSVADDGVGVRPGARSSGTGLGRGIVSQLVTRSRGSVTVETGPLGTTVRVSLPLEGLEDDDDHVPF